MNNMLCKVRDVLFDYEIKGEGKPVLIIGKSIQFHFEPIFESNKGWKRIYVNYPGAGKTKVTDNIKSSDDILDRLLDFIDKIIGNEKFSLIGYSYTSYLARGILKERFKLVDGLLMVVPVIIADMSRRNTEEHRVVFKDNEFISSLSEQELEELSPYVVHNRRVWEKVQQEKDTEEIYLDREFFNNLKEKGLYGFSFDVDDLPNPFDKPTLILLGRQDSIVGYKDAWKIIDNYPRATFAILDMAGHWMPMEQEDLFNTLVAEWLDRVKTVSND